MDLLLVVSDILVSPGTGLVLSPPLDDTVTVEVGDRLLLVRTNGEAVETKVARLVKSHGKTRLAVPMTPCFEVGTEVRVQEEESRVILKKKPGVAGAVSRASGQTPPSVRRAPSPTRR